MRVNFRLALQRLMILSFSILMACASEEVILESKSSGVPVRVDLTGLWSARPDPSVARVPDTQGLQDTIVINDRMNRSRRQRNQSGSSVQMFLEFGGSLKLIQTNYSLFISYDRSIVEEYTFGENRVVSIGPIEARRVSGWQGDKFVVETLDDSGTILFETWYLASDGATLVRDIRIAKGDTETYRYKQFFDLQ
jgi:hypothetical protein